MNTLNNVRVLTLLKKIIRLEVIFVLLFFFSSTVTRAEDGYEIEIRSEIDASLTLKLRLTNLGKEPIKYSLGALSEAKVRILIKDKSGKIIMHPPLFSIAHYPPYHRFLGAGDYFETLIKIPNRYPNLEEALKQKIIVEWDNVFSLTTSENFIKNDLVFEYSKANRTEIRVGSSHEIGGY